MAATSAAAMRQHFKVLSTTQGSSAEQKKNAYKRACLKAHPDKPGGSHEKMAAVNAAWDAVQDAAANATDSANTTAKDDEEDDSKSEGGPTCDGAESGEDSDYDPEFEGEDGCSDGDECAADYGYGDLEETKGSYAVEIEDGIEVTLEQHKEICGCDLESDESIHHLIGAAVGKEAEYDTDDGDSAVGDMKDDTGNDYDSESDDDSAIGDMED